MSYASSSTFGASTSSIPSTSYAKGPPLTIYAPDPCLGAEGAALPSPKTPTSSPKKPSAKSLGKRRETPRGAVKIVPSTPVGARSSPGTASSASSKGKQPSNPTAAEDRTSVGVAENATERTPLVSRSSRSTAVSGRSEGDSRKRFYRARPLWLVPFAIIASVSRGMTVAPRVQVYSQLACDSIYDSQSRWNHTHVPMPASNLLEPPATAASFIHLIFSPIDASTKRPRSSGCTTDPAVQSLAARLQTILATTSGVLSALTTSYWTSQSATWGRTRILALTMLGLLSTDVLFVLIASSVGTLNYSMLFLLLAPVLEGLLGGWTTLQSVSTAYLGDCTSPSSRSMIFSRFTGVFYVGLSLGPSVGAWVLRSGMLEKLGLAWNGKNVTGVFCVAIAMAFVNFVCAALLFPESVGSGKTSMGELEGREEEEDDEDEVQEASQGLLARFIKPLALFLPVVAFDASGRKKRDWSLTWLAGALFAYMLGTGISSIKYLYAINTYNWTTETLSYYVSFMGGARALFLLVILPAIINCFKPKPKVPKPVAIKVPVRNKQGKVVAIKRVLMPVEKPKLTRAQLLSEIGFDLLVAKCCLALDIMANVLVTALPVPAFQHLAKRPKAGVSALESQLLFVGATSLGSTGSGVVPSLASVALGLGQVREMEGGEVKSSEMLGALSVVQVVGQMIFGPILFGTVYSQTVGVFPKGIFVLAAVLVFVGLVLLFVIVLPRRQRDVERGRSRLTKDLRGGAVAY